MHSQVARACSVTPQVQLTAAALGHLVKGAGAVMLQREVPEHVNEAVAAAAGAVGVPVLLVSHPGCPCLQPRFANRQRCRVLKKPCFLSLTGSESAL